jgi:hypothetical protein
MALRRGKATQAVFARAIAATSIYHRAHSGEDEVTTISVDKAEELFRKHSRVKMTRRADGVFVFVISDSYGYERIEIDVGR